MSKCSLALKPTQFQHSHMRKFGCLAKLGQIFKYIPVLNERVETLQGTVPRPYTLVPEFLVAFCLSIH